MSRTNEMRRMLSANSRLPYGLARTAAAEMIARLVENEGPEQFLAEALLDQVEAYVFGQESHKAFVVFSKLLRLWDTRPELFDSTDQRNLFWEFKWIAGDLSDYPQITQGQAEALLADMGHRYAVAGHGQQPVLAARFRWLWHAGLPGAEEARLAWVRAEQDELDDCEACIIGQQVDFFTDTGRFGEAVALGERQHKSCNLEPSRTLYALALAQWHEGDAEAAVSSLRAGRAALDTDTSDFAPARGQEFELLARGGEFEQALRLLRDDMAGLLVKASSPLFRLRFLIGVLAGLAANTDQAEMPTLLTGVDAPTVGALRAWVEREARALARDFDARVGGDAYARRIEVALAATRGAVLPWGASVAETWSDDTPAASPQDAAEPEVDDVDALVAAKRFPEAMVANESAAGRALEEGRLAAAGLAYAEAAQCAHLADLDADAHRLFGVGVPLMQAGGTDDDLLVPVLVAWAEAATRMADTDGVLKALTEAAARQEAVRPAEDVSDDLAARHARMTQANLAAALDTSARIIGSLAPTRRSAEHSLADAAAAAGRAGEVYAHLGQVGDAAHAFWLAGRLQRELGDTQAATWSLESAVEGFTLAHRRTEAADAASDLIDLLRSTGQDAQADQIVASLLT